MLYFEDLVAGAGGVFGESVDLRLKGQVQAEGDLTEPREFEINGALDEVAVRIGPSILQRRRAVPTAPRKRALRELGPTRFEGESAGLEIWASGSIDGADLAGYLRGTVDLAIISSLWSEVRGGGPVAIDATLGGTLEQPDLSGKVAVRGGRLRLIGYPQTLESIDAEAVFERQTLDAVVVPRASGRRRGLRDRGDRVQGRPAGLVPRGVHGANVVAAFPEGSREPTRAASRSRGRRNAR